MKLYRPISTPLRSGLSTEELWHGEDDGLIACWERGREVAIERAALAAQARDGVLVVLPWRGGLERKLAAGKKYGTHRYLAMWQGLRGDALDLDTEVEVHLSCSNFGTTVIFTSDWTKFAGDES